MSINTLTNIAVARRTDFAPAGRAPFGAAENAAVASAVPAPLPAGAAPPAVPPPVPDPNQINTALNVLFGYIPTEVLTLYVAFCAALERPSEAGKVACAEWLTFGAFVLLTPLVVWLVYGAKVIAAGRPVPWHCRTWPVWEMVAATVAYLTWAFALPGSPFRGQGWYSSAVGALAVLSVSTLLGLVAPFVQRRIEAG